MTSPGANWSNTDFPYMCLRDRDRTMALIASVERAVRPGDEVLEVGGGTGILALAAARAGAGRVTVIEIDALLVRTLRQSVIANGMQDVVDVIQGDALEVELPSADVVVAELIETALLDELQVPVLNRLHAAGVIGPRTRLVPRAYRTTVRLADADNEYYGFEILAPKHLWPFYAGDTWVPSRVRTASRSVDLLTDDFGAGPVATELEATVRFEDVPPSGANALEISGAVVMGDGTELGATNALNGCKVLSLERRAIPGADGSLTLALSWERGGGLASVRADLVD